MLNSPSRTLKCVQGHAVFIAGKLYKTQTREEGEYLITEDGRIYYLHEENFNPHFQERLSYFTEVETDQVNTPEQVDVLDNLIKALDGIDVDAMDISHKISIILEAEIKKHLKITYDVFESKLKVERRGAAK